MSAQESDKNNHARGPAPEPVSNLGAALLRVAWLEIILGLVMVAVIKGLEYGCLGLGIGWVSQRRWGGALAHLAVGLLVGLVFGGSEIAYATGGTFQLSAAELLSEGINEVLFPVGCSMVLFSATTLGKSVARHD